MSGALQVELIACDTGPNVLATSATCSALMQRSFAWVGCTTCQPVIPEPIAPVQRRPSSMRFVDERAYQRTKKKPGSFPPGFRS